MTDRRTWKFTDHCCRLCLGRVLVSDNADGTQTAKCSICETEVEGGHRELCACGLKLKSGKSAGLKCQRQANPTSELPARVVAVAL